MEIPKKSSLIVMIIVALFCNRNVFSQAIDLTIDQSQSFVNISVLGGNDVSSITGTGRVNLVPTTEPFETAQIDELDLSMADGFEISLLAGAVTVSVEPDGAGVFFVDVGDPGTVDSNNLFDQFGNVFAVTGLATIDSFAGKENIDLTTVKPVVFDIVEAQLSVAKRILTVRSQIDLDFDFEVLGGTATMNLSGPIVLTGELPEEVALGDVNCDGQINLLDVGPFVTLLSTNGFSDKADINRDGMVNLLDVGPFVDLLSGM